MSAPKKKLFKPLDLDKRMVDWNNMQPTIYGKKINQYDIKTGKPIGRWGVGEIYGGDTTDLFEVFWDVFAELDHEDLEYHGEEYVFNDIKGRMKGDFMDALEEGGPLDHMYFDLTIPMDGEEVRERFEELLKKESLRENETPKKKLFRPIGLSGEDSRYAKWNKEQPIVDGKPINQYTDDGKETGYWEDYFDNGQLYSKGLYVNGKQEGLWEYYFDNGDLKTRVSYKNGKADGLWKWFFTNGQISASGQYKNGKEDGVFEHYWYDGELYRKELYKDGELVKELPLTEAETPKKKLFRPIGLSGEDSRYDKWNKEQPIVDGKPINQFNNNGKKEGLWIEYYEGKIESKKEYKNGEVDGIDQTFYENGQIQFDGHQKNNEFDGLWKMYYRTGELKEIGNYENSYKQGVWKWYYPFENQLEVIVNYVDGRPDGLAMEYFANGNIWKKMVYNLGKKIAYIVYDIDGDVSESMNWKDEYENMVIKEQMENKDKILKSFEPQKELNPKIWDENGKLKKKIKDTLVAIGQEFHKTLEVEAPIDDIIFTGSLANYNWSQYSDVDLHVLMDFNEFDDKELIKKYFDAKKAYWNDNHDIKIKGYDVELYAQDTDEPHESTGIYSVMKDEWVRKPKPQDVKIDRETIKKKVKQFEGEYNRIVQLYSEEKYEETKKALDKIKDKIKKYRKAGLDKGGEMATENLVFKTMRRSGLMDKIYKLGLETTDKEYTIETLDENETPKKKRLFAPIGLSGEDSRWVKWNKEQPIKDGQPINQYTNDGKKTGYWEDYYFNGKLASKGSYKDGKHDGIWEWYHLNGNLRSKGPYENGKSKGIWEEYFYEDGKLAGRGEYVNDKREGIWEYYYGSGEIYSKGEYINGMKNGVWLYYHPNGRLFLKKLYKNDKTVGELPLTEAENISEGKIGDNIGETLKKFKKNIGLDVGFLTSFGAGINALIRNISSLIKEYSVQPLTAFEITNLAIAMIVVYFRKGKSLKGFKEEMLSIAAFTSLMPAYADIVNSLLGNVDFMEAFMTIIKSAGVYTMLTHFKSK